MQLAKRYYPELANALPRKWALDCQFYYPHSINNGMVYQSTMRLASIVRTSQPLNENPLTKRISLRQISDELSKRLPSSIPDSIADVEVGAAAEWFQEKGWLKIGYLFDKTGNALIGDSPFVFEISRRKIRLWLADFRITE